MIITELSANHNDGEPAKHGKLFICSLSTNEIVQLLTRDKGVVKIHRLSKQNTSIMLVHADGNEEHEELIDAVREGLVGAGHKFTESTGE